MGFWILIFASWIWDFKKMEFGSWFLDSWIRILDVGFWIVDLGLWIFGVEFWFWYLDFGSSLLYIAWSVEAWPELLLDQRERDTVEEGDSPKLFGPVNVWKHARKKIHQFTLPWLFSVMMELEWNWNRERERERESGGCRELRSVWHGQRISAQSLKLRGASCPIKQTPGLVTICEDVAKFSNIRGYFVIIFEDTLWRCCQLKHGLQNSASALHGTRALWTPACPKMKWSAKPSTSKLLTCDGLSTYLLQVRIYEHDLSFGSAADILHAAREKHSKHL